MQKFEEKIDDIVIKGDLSSLSSSVEITHPDYVLSLKFEEGRVYCETSLEKTIDHQEVSLHDRRFVTFLRWDSWTINLHYCEEFQGLNLWNGDQVKLMASLHSVKVEGRSFTHIPGSTSYFGFHQDFGEREIINEL